MIEHITRLQPGAIEVFCILCFVVILSEPVAAQANASDSLMRSWTFESTREWSEYAPADSIPEGLVVRGVRQLFHVSDADTLTLVTQRTDTLGRMKKVYAQKHAGIDVAGAFVNIVRVGSSVVVCSARLMADADTNSANILCADSAVFRLRADTLWPFLSTDSVLVSSPVLSYVIDVEQSADSIGGSLWYSVELARVDSSGDTLNGGLAWVKADSGRVASIENEGARLCAYSASGETSYNGLKTFGVGYTGSQYFSWINCASPGEGKIDVGYVDAAGNGQRYFVSSSDDWTAPLSATDEEKSVLREVVSALWAGQETYSYLFNHFGRRGWNNSDDVLYINVHTTEHDLRGQPLPNGTEYAEARIDGGISFNNPIPTTLTVNIGKGGGVSSTGPWTSVETIAHEIAHGVNHANWEMVGKGKGWSADIVRYIQTPAIDEGLADIHGVMVDFQTGSGDYVLGEDFLHTGLARSMSDPKAAQLPDTYFGEYWTYPYRQHINVGVVDYWFYLLAEGGSGTNDNNHNYLVESIGRDKAARIAYDGADSYMSKTSDFPAFRKATVRAAKDLYGECSNEQLQVARAWYAVGVGGNPDAIDVLCGTIDNLQTQFLIGTWIIPACPSNYSNPQLNVTPSGRVYVRATEEILLKPGFYAQSGSGAVFYIGGCTAGLQRPVVQNAEHAGTGNANRLRVVETRARRDAVEVLIESTCGAVIRMSVYTVLGEEVAGDISVALNADGLYLARVPYEVLSRGTLALVAETPCGIVSSLVRYDH